MNLPIKKNLLPTNPEVSQKRGRFPSWLHRSLPKGGSLFQTQGIVDKYRLNTVCEEAKCPNRLECYAKKTATFLALGKECTRNCGFCAIDFSKTPQKPEADEPLRIAQSVQELGLRHVVITMVARDDLPLGGAVEFARIITTVRSLCPHVAIEVLTSDFSGDPLALDEVLTKSPDVFNHNLETVRELTPRVRHKATYERSLYVLEYAAKANAKHVKSGLMVGLGENKEQVFQALRDLHQVGCDIVTIGQYLQADQRKLLVKEFIHPAIFQEYEAYGLSLGIAHVYSGPFVRSSYNAAEILSK